MNAPDKERLLYFLLLAGIIGIILTWIILF